MRNQQRTELTGAALEAAVQKIKAELGDANGRRLDLILPLVAHGRASQGKCLRSLFPDQKLQGALVRFRQFRAAIATAAKDAGINLELVVDSKKRTPADARECWFEGEDIAEGELARFTSESVADTSGKPYIPSRGVPAMVSSKRPVSLFISYAEEDAARVDVLLNQLKLHLKISRSYIYDVWRDRDCIISGEGWEARLADGLGKADFGLFMLSPALLGSQVVIETELPVFKGDEKQSGKPFIPVCLVPVDRKLQEMQGLDEKQLYRWASAPGYKKKCFSELGGAKEREAFALKLFGEVEKRLNDWFAGKPPHKPGLLPAPVTPACEEKKDERDLEVDFLLEESEKIKYVRARAKAASLRHGPAESEEKGEDAVAFLEKWLVGKNEPPFCAVLGEYGIGKTTTLQFFSRELLRKRKTNPNIPLPIFLDLRNYKQPLKTIPELKDIIAEIIRRSWRVTEKPALDSSDVIRAVREKGAVIIFDGLDEKIVQLPPDGARAFIRELWNVLPPPLIDDAKKKGLSGTGRMIISCRSHYFRDVISQNSMLTGEDREGMDADKHYRALFMLPFTNEQIREYLAGVPGLAGRVDEVMDLMASIHNLKDLAKRPYLLSLITAQIEELEKMRAVGKTVQAVDLYDLIVKKWLARDDGKHQIGAAHKRFLMEHLAAAMWCEETRMWEVDRLETWFDEFFMERPAIAGAYADKPRELLKEDLRNSTFVLRPDSEEKSFRFAHTSMQEYFLATFLVRALREGRPDDWNLPSLSRETLDFAGQLLRMEKDGKCLKTLEELLENQRPRATLNAFRYWLLAVEKEHPRPSPVSPVLKGEDLEGIEIRGRDAAHMLALPGINLEGAWLARARIENVNMTGAKLAGCAAPQSEFLNDILNDADARGANLVSSVWRDCLNDGMQLDAAVLEGSEWIRPSEWNPQWNMRGAVSCGMTTHLPDRQLHSRISNYCSATMASISPDGARIVSASADNLVRVWDAKTGKALLTMEGHKDGVNSAMYSPDGARIVSASADNAVRVWDAKTGKALLTMEGHKDEVRSAMYSLDGRRIVSTSSDCTGRVWDAKTGTAMLTLEGHTGVVKSAMYSPDGARIATASWDGTVRVWDAKTGKVLLTLAGHKDPVNSAMFSPNGARIATASWDGTVRVWDAKTGKALLSMEGHKDDVHSAMFSPDGAHILSASFDCTVRVWDAITGRTLLTLELGPAAVWSAMYSPDGERIVAALYPWAVCVWDAKNWRKLLELKDHNSKIKSVTCSPDSGRILTLMNDGTVQVWDAKAGRALLELEGHGESAVFSMDGTRIAVASLEGPVQVWDAKTGQALLTLDAHKELGGSATFSPDGARIATASREGPVRVWDVTTGRALLTLERIHGLISVVFSPDGSRIATASREGRMRVWDAKTGRALLTLEGNKGMIWPVVFSPDGTRIAMASLEGPVQVWDAKTGKALLTLDMHKELGRLATFSPDGSRIYLASYDGKMQVWDAASGLALLTLDGHKDRVVSISFSKNGAHIVSASADKTLRVWDAKTGLSLLTLEGHESSVLFARYSLDGMSIVSASSDNTIRLWDAATGKEIWSLLICGEEESTLVRFSENKILAASPGAWRYLEWRKFDEATGSVEILPAEFYGPLPLQQ